MSGSIQGFFTPKFVAKVDNLNNFHLRFSFNFLVRLDSNLAHLLCFLVFQFNCSRFLFAILNLNIPSLYVALRYLCLNIPIRQF